MPDYGVGASDWEALPWTWAAERLETNRNFWVVTATADGRPHALPVWGVWNEGQRRFAFSCSPRARKARNLAANPQAVVMTDDTVECLSVEGRAEPVSDDERREAWIDRYLVKYRPLSADINADFLRAHLMFEFTPDRAFAVIEREDEFSTRATRWMF
jgi:hypothetical protein